MALGGVCALLGCVHMDTPRQVLRRYVDALAQEDAERVWELSDSVSQRSLGPDGLGRWMKKNPRLVVAAFDRSVGALRKSTMDESDESVSFLSDDAVITLVRESGSWRVALGGLLLPRFDTPEAALKTYFFAATGHLGLYRQLLPLAAQQEYESDYALGTLLYAQRDRIFAARDHIGSIYEGRAVRQGNRAIIAYGTNKECILVREDGRWRVSSIE